MVALQPLDKRGSERARQERVFAPALLPPSPARVAEEVDIGRPKGQPGIDVVDAQPQRLVMLGPRLIGDAFMRDTQTAHLRHPDVAVPALLRLADAAALDAAATDLRVDLPDDAVMVQQERAYTSPIWYSP